MPARNDTRSSEMRSHLPGMSGVGHVVLLGYHLIKAALLRDPVWSDLRSLTAINVDLTPEQRFTDRHRGRRRIGSNQPREWGINDLVFVLYRPAARFYERLHQASIDVRYGTGLPAGALPDLDTALKALFEMDSRNEIEAPLLWTPDGGAGA